MSDDLVAELRKEPRIEPFSNQGEPDYRASLEHRAADELDRLRAENERLRQIIVKNWCGDYWRGVTNEHADEINAAIQTEGCTDEQT